MVDVGADHVGALAREDQRGGLADAAGGAGNDDGLSAEVVRRLGHGCFLAAYVNSCPGRVQRGLLQPERNETRDPEKRNISTPSGIVVWPWVPALARKRD